MRASERPAGRSGVKSIHVAPSCGGRFVRSQDRLCELAAQATAVSAPAPELYAPGSVLQERPGRVKATGT